MTGCEECAAAREASGHHARFDNRKCVYCAARCIQFIGKLAIGKTEASERRKAALAVSVEAGLDEKEIRALVKGPMAVAPLTDKKEKKRK